VLSTGESMQSPKSSDYATNIAVYLSHRMHLEPKSAEKV